MNIEIAAIIYAIGYIASYISGRKTFKLMGYVWTTSDRVKCLIVSLLSFAGVLIFWISYVFMRDDYNDKPANW